MKEIAKVIVSMLKSALVGMKETIDVLWDSFESPNSCMSRDARKIFAHPEDRKLYIEACDRLRAGSKEETVTFQTVGTVTLIMIQGPHIIG